MENKFNRLIIASYRIPYRYEEDEHKSIKFIRNSGGLVSAILSLAKKMFEDGTLVKNQKILWFGFSDLPIQENSEKLFEDEYFEVHPIHLQDSIHKPFYEGFCNSSIWPLFHYYPYITSFEKEDFLAYQNANLHFFNSLKPFIKPGDLIWVHDYQLMLLPKLIRQQWEQIMCGFFLHIPFPSYEVFRIMPTEWKKEILNGLLGSDLIGLHTKDYKNYFLDAVKYELRYRINKKIIFCNSREVKVDHFPIGIDYEFFNSMYDNLEVEAEREKFQIDSNGKKIIFSIDRLDYSKGLVHRLNGYEKFLEEYPNWLENVIFYMVIIPSRDSIPQYQNMKQELEETIGRINGKYGNFNWRPIIYLYRSLSTIELMACFTMADVALITPIRDGMNLIAKEFVASRKDKMGVLILSELAGAASELNGAILINPIDKNLTANAINEALKMEKVEQVDRMELMQYRVKNFNVLKWGEVFIKELEKIKKDQKKIILTGLMDNNSKQEFISKFKTSKNRLILLDYDGTLVDLDDNPSEIIPSIESINVLKKITSNSRNTLVIISGRSKHYLELWFNKMNVIMIAEHGFYVKYPGEKNWKQEVHFSNEWKTEFIEILKKYTEKITDSYIEEKESTLNWDYRVTDLNQSSPILKDLIEKLKKIINEQKYNLDLLINKKSIEIRQAGCNKGTSSKKLFKSENFEFILCVGDDVTDEDMFESMPRDAYSFKVGFEQSKAKFHLENPNKVIEMLNLLI